MTGGPAKGGVSAASLSGGCAPTLRYATAPANHDGLARVNRTSRTQHVQGSSRSRYGSQDGQAKKNRADAVHRQHSSHFPALTGLPRVD